MDPRQRECQMSRERIVVPRVAPSVERAGAVARRPWRTTCCRNQGGVERTGSTSMGIDGYPKHGACFGNVHPEELASQPARVPVWSPDGGWLMGELRRRWVAGIPPGDGVRCGHMLICAEPSYTDICLLRNLSQAPGQESTVQRPGLAEPVMSVKERAALLHGVFQPDQLMRGSRPIRRSQEDRQESDESVVSPAPANEPAEPADPPASPAVEPAVEPAAEEPKLEEILLARPAGPRRATGHRSRSSRGPTPQASSADTAASEAADVPVVSSSPRSTVASSPVVNRSPRPAAASSRPVGSPARPKASAALMGSSRVPFVISVPTYTNVTHPKRHVEFTIEVAHVEALPLDPLVASSSHRYTDFVKLQCA